MQLAASTPSDGRAEGGGLQEPSAAAEDSRMGIRSGREGGSPVRGSKASVGVLGEERGAEAACGFRSKRRACKAEGSRSLQPLRGLWNNPIRTRGR